MHSKNVEIKIYTSAHNWVIFSKLEGGRCCCSSSNDGPDISFEIRKAPWFTLQHKNIKLSFSACIPCSFVYYGEKIFLKGTCKPKKSIREKDHLIFKVPVFLDCVPLSRSCLLTVTVVNNTVLFIWKLLRVQTLNNSL